MILLYWIILCTVFFHWWGQLRVECVHTERKICGFRPVVTYLIEMWLLEHGKCIYLDSNLTFYILVSLCGFKHYTSNGERTSRMTSQDFKQCKPRFLAKFPSLSLKQLLHCSTVTGKWNCWGGLLNQSQFAVGYAPPTCTVETHSDTRSSAAGEGGLKCFLGLGVARVSGSVGSVFNHRLAED